ncbi:S9 family peptidase [Proteiniclasticum sp. QWL-01]|uniref:alpha/beta hydrolase family protein n=1 Tax=Proteiniclasticum sp. QWL-01 TaxID=3036945 RepID=UPI002410AC80|nr:S9 family peptidase [Proteiniclasticum sp. QWL-01]WFF72814.1 S9 family peptidase [Proteiniclasticum sp. QWL-01]
MQKVLIEDLKDIRFLSAPEFNEAGTWLAFIRTQPDLEENGYQSDIWLHDVKKGESWRLTASDEVTGFVWDGNDHLIFSANRKQKDKDQAKKDDFTNLYRIYLKGGEAEKFITLPAKAGKVERIDESRYLFTMSTDLKGQDLHILKDEAEKKKELDRREAEKDFETIEEIPFWSNGGGFTAGKRGRLCLYDAKTKKITALNKGKTSIHDFSLNDAKTLALVTIDENKGVAALESKLGILDVAAKKVSEVKIGKHRIYDAQFLDDETAVLLISEGKLFGLNENPKFFLLNLKSLELQPILEDQDFSIGSSINSDMRYGGGHSLIVKDGWIYYVETNDTDSLLKRMDRHGKIEVLMDEPGSVDAFDVSSDGTIVFVGMETSGLQELYRVEKRSRVRLTSFNEDYLKNHQVLIPESIRSRGEGDDIVNGFVLKPADYKKGKKYPGILVIHGGPKTAYGSVFYHEMQVWANLGYFVFFCNPKGSDGKGNEFADIRGRYGSVDYENLMDFTDKVLDTYPDIDEKRVGVTGGSYGGFMTNWIIGHSKAFRCAASQRSISNWMSFFGNSDIGYFFAPNENDAWPWKNPEKMWELSPLKYADQCTTPTLFIHSDQDYRCWIPEAFQMFTALKLHGCEARMAVFHGETHELSRSGKPKGRIRRLTEITNWFEKYLK